MASCGAQRAPAHESRELPSRTASISHGTRLALRQGMYRSLLAIVLFALVACSSRSAPETIPGPALGESTAGLPANPSAPNPDASEPVPVSSRLSPQAVEGAQAAPAASAPAAVGGAPAPIPSEIGAAGAVTPIAADGGVAPSDAGVRPLDAAPRPGVSDAGSPAPDGGPRPGVSDAGVPR
ncbi:MAG TPA: hypothetical protein VIU61_28240 [Kofleriaceae bacterium]